MPLIKLNATQALTGALPAVSGANLTGVSAGKVLQVVSTTKTDTTSTSSSSYVDISGMSLSITPASSSNKIFLMFDIGASSTSDGRSDKIRLLRDSTAIVDPANLFRVTANSVMYNASTNFLDSPNTTSATTYKLQWLSEAGGATCYLNRRGINSTVFTTSTITAMEIEA